MIGQFKLVKYGSFSHPVLTEAGRVGVKVSAVRLVHRHSFSRADPPLRRLVAITMGVDSYNLDCTAIVLVGLKTGETKIRDRKHTPRNIKVYVKNGISQITGPAPETISPLTLRLFSSCHKRVKVEIAFVAQ